MFVITRKITIIMLFIAFGMMGIYSYRQLPSETLPNMDLPFLNVHIQPKDRTSTTITEQNVVIPIEGIISTLHGVEKITSRISSRNTQIRVQFASNAPIKKLLIDLKEKINASSSSWEDYYDVYVDRSQTNHSAAMVMILGASGEGSIDQIRKVIETKAKPLLEAIEGVAETSIWGGRKQLVQVTYNEKELETLRITPAQLLNAMNRSRRQAEWVGNLQDTNQLYFVTVSSEYRELLDFRNIIIDAERGLRLGDVAQISFDFEESKDYARVNDQNILGILIERNPMTNIIEVAHHIHKELPNINRELAAFGIAIEVFQDASESIKEGLDNVINMGLLGVLLAVLILWLFLGNFPIISTIAVSIPFSILGGLLAFYLFDISINQLSILGLALAVGMLLDNSIIVIENIFRLKKQGKNEAIVKGSQEVARSIFASTLTTMAIFVPFLFASEQHLLILGKQVGVGIVASLGISLAVALILIPTLVHTVGRSYFRQEDSTNKWSNHLIIRQYRIVLKYALRNPLIILFSTVVLFFLSFSISFLRTSPPERHMDMKSIRSTLYPPAGATIQLNDSIARTFSTQMQKLEGVDKVYSNIREEYVSFMVKVVPEVSSSEKKYNELLQSVNKIVQSNPQFLGDSYSGIANNEEEGPAEQFLSHFGIGNRKERIIIRGNNYPLMLSVANQIKEKLEEIEYHQGVWVEYRDDDPAVQLDVDRVFMNKRELSVNNINMALRSLRKEHSATFEYTGKDNQKYEVTIRPDTVIKKVGQRLPMASMEDLQNLNIPDNHNNLHRLEDFTSMNITTNNPRIVREDRIRSVRIGFRFDRIVYDNPSVKRRALEQIQEILENTGLPDGVLVELQKAEDETEPYKFLFILGFLLVYFILASIFQSFSVPLIIILSIPASTIGSFVILGLAGEAPISANTMIGMLILVGITVNNGILLIDCARQLKKRGYSVSRSIIEAGINRLRPVLMTALTTILALLPLALGTNSTVRAIGGGFALTVSGGLAVGTLITLILIPTSYLLLHHATLWFQSLHINTRRLNVLLLIGSLIFTYFTFSSILTRSIIMVLLLFAVPLTTYFLQNVTRRSDKRMLAQKETSISIQNVVKIYNRPNPFFRELKVAVRQYVAKNSFVFWKWQLPVWVFLFWFSFFYLENSFYILCMTLLTWQLLKNICVPLKKYTSASKSFKILSNLSYWAIPVVFMSFASYPIDNTTLVLLISITWYVVRIIRKLKQRGKLKKLPILTPPQPPFKALRGVSMDLEKGMIGLLGANGAGKTTLMRILCGMLYQSYGKVYVNGHDTLTKQEELQSIIGYLPQYFGMYGAMSPMKYLNYMAILRDIPRKNRKERIEEVLHSVNMWEWRSHKIKSFSGGMKQRIGIAQMLLHSPRILIVDEPTAGLDPEERIRLRNLLSGLSKERIVIFSTHIIEDIAGSCDQLVIMRKGELIYFGQPLEIIKKTQGKVWEMTIERDAFETWNQQFHIILHINKGDKILLRILHPTSPHTEAQSVLPTLEDAYLWLEYFD